MSYKHTQSNIPNYSSSFQVSLQYIDFRQIASYALQTHPFEHPQRFSHHLKHHYNAKKQTKALRTPDGWNRTVAKIQINHRHYHVKKNLQIRNELLPSKRSITNSLTQFMTFTHETKHSNLFRPTLANMELPLLLNLISSINTQNQTK